VKPADALVYVFIALLVILVALASIYIPARGAMCVDP
jgi:hypothetical protein